MTNGQKTLRELIQARLGNNPFPLSSSQYAVNQWIRGGYRPVWHFQRADCGGSDAGRQIRFLRLQHNVPIEMKTHQYTDGYGRQRSIPIYRLDLTIEMIGKYDWTKALQTPFTWTYDGPRIVVINFDHPSGQGAWV